jgi:hypothetical protein
VDNPVIDLIYSSVWLGGIIFAPFVIVESIVSSDIKKRLSEFLKSKAHALDDLPPIAAQLFELVFGKSHFSFRCLGASVVASLFFLTLLYVLRLLLIIAVNNEGTSQYEQVIEELKYPFVELVRASFAISIVANLVLDYFGLLKTRLIISFLVRKQHSVLRGMFAILADLLFSFIVFQTFYMLFYLVGFIFLFGYGRIILPGGDPRTFGPMFEILILLHFATDHVYPSGTAMHFLTHSHAISVFLFFTFFPIFITSVFFYASIAPSIWLWLFVMAAVISRVIAPLWPVTLHTLNFEQAPIKMIGLVAGIAVAVLWILAIVVLAMGLATLSAFLQ